MHIIFEGQRIGFKRNVNPETSIVVIPVDHLSIEIIEERCIATVNCPGVDIKQYELTEVQYKKIIIGMKRSVDDRLLVNAI